MTVEQVEKCLLDGPLCCITVATPYKEEIFLVEGVDPENASETVVQYLKNEKESWLSDWYVSRKMGPYDKKEIRWILDRNEFCTVLDKDGYVYDW